MTIRPSRISSRWYLDQTGSCYIKPLLTGSKIRQDSARFLSANLLTICGSYLVSSGFVSFKTELYLESKFILTRYWLKCVTDFYSRVLIAQVRISIDLKNTASQKSRKYPEIFSMVVWRLFLHVYIIQISTNRPLKDLKRQKLKWIWIFRVLSG